MMAWTDSQFAVLGIACLILALAAFRGERVGLKRTVVMVLAWGAIILLTVLVFSAIGP